MAKENHEKVGAGETAAGNTLRKNKRQQPVTTTPYLAKTRTSSLRRC
ncbi:MAG: hypothetical protein PHV80_03305 [Rugosibacter sp.]|nr:hypothetical protein [Rugosibacter sp.]